MTNSVKVEITKMSNGYEVFVCPKCGHRNPIVMSSSSMQQLADLSNKFNCENCLQEVERNQYDQKA